MKSLFLILILILSPNAIAQSGFSNENSISGNELANLKNELKIVEKDNNEKYKNTSNADMFMQLYSGLSQVLAKFLGKNSLPSPNAATNTVQTLKPEILSDGSEIYTQRIFFKYTASEQRRLEKIKIARIKAMLRKRKNSIENNFASNLDYNL